jgi:hypothetical protein
MFPWLDQAQCQVLERAWRNFDIVIGQLPLSDITALLAFHSRQVLGRLARPPVDVNYMELVTRRVLALMNTSPVLLDVDDMLSLLDEALAQVTNKAVVGSF